MKKNLLKCLLFVYLGMCCYNCNLQKEIIDLELIMKSYNYIQSTDSFQMKVLGHIPCGDIRHKNLEQCVDCLIGVKQNNDTIRVLCYATYNDVKFIYEENDIVWVFPKEKPDYPITMSLCIQKTNRNKWNLCDWQTKNYNTIFGEIRSVNSTSPSK